MLVVSPVMAQVQKKAHRLKPVALVMAMAKYKCAKVYLRYNKLVLPVVVKVRLFQVLVPHVVDRVELKRIKPYLLKFHRVLIPVTEFVYLAKVKQVSMVHQLSLIHI